MTIGLLVIWLLVGIDFAGSGPSTPLDAALAGDDLVATMDGPVLTPPPNP
jgi:hypothetical protein